MNLKRQISLLMASGFFSGAAAAAWWFAGHHAGGPGGPSQNVAGDGNEAAAAALSGGDTVQSWQALQASGSQGLMLLLAQTELIQRAPVRDLPRLLELAGSDQTARGLLIRRWVALDPAGAADWVAPLLKSFYPEPPGRESDVEMVFGEWAKKDPEAAMAVFRTRAAAGDFYIWAERILNRVVNDDMAAGVRFGALAGSGVMLNQVSFSIFRDDWTGTDPVRAAALLQELPAGEFRDLNLVRTIGQLAQTDFEAALALQKKFPDLGFDWRVLQICSDFFQEWARRDWDGLGAFVTEKADPKAAERLRQIMLSVMADKDPAGALKWGAENLSFMGSGALDKISRKDPEAVLAWLGTLPAGTILTSSMDIFCGTLPERDAAHLLAKAESLPEGDARQAMTIRAYGRMYETDPETALKNLTSLPPDNVPDGLWKALGEQSEHLKAGIAAAKTIPPEASLEFISGLFDNGSVYRMEPKDFADALNSLPNPEQRAAALKSGGNQMLSGNTAAFVDWAKSLPEPERALISNQLAEKSYGLSPTRIKEFQDSLR